MTRKCPECQKRLRYPEEHEVCPECGYEVAEWFEKNQKGIAEAFGVDTSEDSDRE
jgi:endogenous inhibitor of DNA gyrase (YacG/DUF329 family)